MMTALAALSAGCSAVMITDVLSEKLALAARYAGLVLGRGCRIRGEWSSQGV